MDSDDPKVGLSSILTPEVEERAFHDFYSSFAEVVIYDG